MTAPRRTQAERRETTVFRLLDATIEAIAEIGYARTSLGEVCTRSGVSKGGMFRYFESRTALMVGAAEEVARRHIDSARKTSSELGEVPPVVGMLRIIRDRVRSKENTVWHELLVAARTDADLRAGLTPAMTSMIEQIEIVAREFGPTDDYSDAELALLLTTLQHTFDGEAIRRVVVPDEDLEERRLALLAEFAEFVASRGRR